MNETELKEIFKAVDLDIPDTLYGIVQGYIGKIGNDDVKSALQQIARLAYRKQKGSIGAAQFKALIGAAEQTIRAKAKAAVLEKRTALLAFLESVWKVLIEKALTKI